MGKPDIPGGTGRVIGAWVPSIVMFKFDVEAKRRKLSRAGLARQIIYQFLDDTRKRPAA